MFEKNSARLEVEMAGVKCQMLHFIDLYCKQQKEEISQIVDEALQAFDIEAYIKAEADKAIREQVDKQITMEVSSKLGWNKAMMLEIRQKAREIIDKRLRGL